MERTANPPGGALGVELVGGGAGAGVDGEHGPERRSALVEGGDAGEKGVGDLAARAGARRHVGLELGDGALGDDARSVRCVVKCCAVLR